MAKTVSNMLLSFPEGYTPRTNQIKILTEIEKGITSGQKFMIVNAPTGAGKSFIGKTISNYVKAPTPEFVDQVNEYIVYNKEFEPDIDDRRGVFALTITKSLQDQYVETFDDTGVLKGQGNYICDLDNISSVDTAPCNFIPNQKKSCWACNRCSYYNDRNNMLVQRFSTLNYSMFFALPENVKHRKVLILDEGSELEEQLVAQFTCNIDFKILQQHDIDFDVFPVNDEDRESVAKWVGDTTQKCVERLQSYARELKDLASKKSSQQYKKAQSNYSFLLNYTRSINLLRTTFFQANYIISKESTTIKFIPLYVNKLSSYLFDYADHVVILSATIVDCESYARILGIDDYRYISVKSEYDPQKAPILVKADQKINYANQQKMLPVMVKQIKQLMDEHADQKGIIHTHTQMFADFIKDNIDSDRLLVRTAGVTNEDIMEKHMATDEPTILVSPSMTYGVDLKEELGEFQIIMKTPWLPTKEPRTERMMKFSNSWYVNKMLCTLIQACGRIIRSENCTGPTYILDGGVLPALMKSKKKLPESFLNRIL